MVNELVKIFAVLIAWCALIGLEGCVEKPAGGPASGPALVRCYSGGGLVYEGGSLGQVMHSGGTWVFAQSTDGQIVRISGTCVIIGMAR